jgi:2-oxoisovalerate dehydrogenase E1 component
MANEKSPTHGREGNVHHGNVAMRRFPMISHLGDMMPVAVGAVWGARKNGEDVFGLGTIGDGGSSTGDIHEAMNIASVRKIPVLFLIENNHYAYSTPTKLQYNCKQLSDRAIGYGMSGTTIDGTDVWEVYDAVYEALKCMSQDSMPRIIESMTLRLEGHAVYDKAEYVSKAEYDEWMKREPLMRARKALGALGYHEDQITDLEKRVADEVEETTREALGYCRPTPALHRCGSVYAPSEKAPVLPPFKLEKIRNLNAVTAALDYILQHFPSAIIVGQDIGVYGSAFKSCKGLYEKYGPDRIFDMPVAESGTVGVCLGASQTGLLPIMEFQFADFATEATTQLALNSGTWFFRTDKPAQMLFRMPCGGGINLGAFHSGEFEGLWSRFPGLKVVYPVTPQETFEALIAGFIDPNPCIVLEHKLLYSGRQETVEFDGNCVSLLRPRKYTDGSAITIIATGAMVETVLSVVRAHNYSAEVWNPYILNPLELEPVLESVRKTGRLLVVQESGASAGIGDKIISLVCRNAYGALHSAPRLISAPDEPVPFAKELELGHIPNAIEINQVIAIMIGEIA